MTLAIRPPRKSALGVHWCEDFSRGRLGVRKNQGTILEAAAPDTLRFQGDWLRFPNDYDSYIRYPVLPTRYKTAITVMCWIRNVVDTGQDQFVVAMATNTAYPTNVEFYIYLEAGNSEVGFIIETSALAFGRARTFAYTDPTEEILITGTWETGDNVRLYFNGLQVALGGVINGSLNPIGNPLTLGRFATGVGRKFNGEMKDPLVDFRKWSADEILKYYNKRLF